MKRHLWQCKCGMEWKHYHHEQELRRTSRFWRSDVYELNPWKQWVAENMPKGQAGFVQCADDLGITAVLIADDNAVRTHSRTNELGVVARLELKTFGRGLDDATRLTLRAEADPNHRVLPICIELTDGNVPTPLRHWPTPCPCCGAPGEEVVATECRSRVITGDPWDENPPKPFHPSELRGRLLTYLKWDGLRAVS